MEYQILGFRTWSPCKYGTGTMSFQWPFQLLLNSKGTSYPDYFRESFNINFKFDVERSEWWNAPALEITTDNPQIAMIAAKFFAAFAEYCSKSNLKWTPETFFQFAASKKIPHTFYEPTVGRTYTNSATRAWYWSLNGQSRYGSVLAFSEKEAMKKIDKNGYSTTRNKVELEEFKPNLKEFLNFNPLHFNNPTL